MIWKILIWVYSILYLLIVIVSLDEVKWKLVDWLGIVAVIVGIIFLYGFAYRKKFLSIKSRQFIIGTSILYWLVYISYLDRHYGAYPGNTIGDAIFNFLIVLPVFIPAVLFATKVRK